MKINWRILLVALAISFGLIVLAGYFIDLPVLTTVRELLLRGAAILAAVALLVGLANLFTVHWRKLMRRETGWSYSLVLILAMLLTLVVVAPFGPAAPLSMWIFQYIQMPVESSLLALLAVLLVLAVLRLFSRRMNLFSFVFFLTALLVLVGTASLPGFSIPVFSEIRSIIQVPAAAGARGILLGVALGTVATGLRILMGADRPYGGS